MIDRICSLIKMEKPLRNRGLLFASGVTVPSDEADGYQTGCIFQHTDGDVGSSLYINEGSVTSCAFNAVEGLESITLADLVDVADGFATRLLETGTYANTASAGVVLSATNTRPMALLCDDGGANLDSGNFRPFLSRMLLTIDQTGSTITPVRGQLKLNAGIDVGTGIYAPIQGYIEVAGTSKANSAATLSCISASLEITTALTAESGGFVAGVHVETTGAGTLTATGTVAGVLIDKASGAADWPVGVEVQNSVTGVEIGACTTGVLLSGAITTGISITSTSLTDGIKISGTTPVDGVEVSSVCSAAAFHVSGTSATGLSIAGACTTEAITIATQAVSLMTAGLTTTGSSKLDGIDYNWSTATTYGAAGDRWGGNGNMEAFLTIGDAAAASIVSGAGSHLGQYINLSYTATAGDANDLCGALYTAVSYGATETIGKVCGITSHIRNPDQDISGASQECNAIRALMYTGTGGELQHYTGILLGVLDMTTTKSNAQDIIGMRVQLNVADNSSGGNLSGIVFDNVGTVEPDTGLWYLANNWTYAMVAADGGATPKPASDSGTVGTAAGAIKVKVGGSVRYIPLYTTYSA